MLVTCHKDRQSDIPEQFRRYAFGQDDTGKLPLTIGKKYVVSAIKYVAHMPFLLIINDIDELKARPWWYPSTLFDVISDEKPNDWIEAADSPTFKIEGFPEIVDDAAGTFYQALEDGDEAAIKVFLKHYEAYARHHDLWYADKKPAKYMLD